MMRGGLTEVEGVGFVEEEGLDLAVEGGVGFVEEEGVDLVEEGLAELGFTEEELVILCFTETSSLTEGTGDTGETGETSEEVTAFFPL